MVKVIPWVQVNFKYCRSTGAACFLYDKRIICTLGVTQTRHSGTLFQVDDTLLKYALQWAMFFGFQFMNRITQHIP